MNNNSTSWYIHKRTPNKLVFYPYDKAPKAEIDGSNLWSQHFSAHFSALNHFQFRIFRNCTRRVQPRTHRVHGSAQARPGHGMASTTQRSTTEEICAAVAKATPGRSRRRASASVKAETRAGVPATKLCIPRRCKCCGVADLL